MLAAFVFLTVGSAADVELADLEAAARHNLSRITSFRVKQIYFHKAFTVKHRKRPGGRNINRIIEIKTQHLPLRLHRARNPESFTSNADSLSQRIVHPKYFLPEFTA